jgi:hypothetical protein
MKRKRKNTLGGKFYGIQSYKSNNFRFGRKNQITHIEKTSAFHYSRISMKIFLVLRGPNYQLEIS